MESNLAGHGQSKFEEQRSLSPHVRLVFCMALICAGVSSPLSVQAQTKTENTAPTRAAIEALLGSRDQAASAEQWRSLGVTAAPILAAIAADQSALPTRRGRSIDGLAALGSPDAVILLQQLAYDEQAPLIVRMSAIRGLAELPPEGLRSAALRPLLKEANPQLRGVVAEVLSYAPDGCAELRDVVTAESEAWRARFVRNCPALTPSREPVIDQAVASSSDKETETTTIPLGKFTVYTTQLSNPITLQVPGDAFLSKSSEWVPTRPQS